MALLVEPTSVHCLYNIREVTHYALEIRDAIHAAGFSCEEDVTDRTLQKKIREAQLAQFNYILVVDEKRKPSPNKLIPLPLFDRSVQIFCCCLMEWYFFHESRVVQIYGTSALHVQHAGEHPSSRESCANRQVPARITCRF